MKFSYRFSNLLGTVYCKGNIIFSPDGNSVISPVGNRISIFDLKNNKSSTLPVESNFNFTFLEMSPDGSTLLAVNEDHYAYLISMISRQVIHMNRIHFKPLCLRFSPNCKFFAIGAGSEVVLFKAPGPHTGEYNPFMYEKTCEGATGDIICVAWSFDSRLIAAGSEDMTVRIFAARPLANVSMVVLAGHSDPVIHVCFEKDSLDLISVARNGQVLVWEASIDADALREYVPPPKKGKTEEDSDGEEKVFLIIRKDKNIRPREEVGRGEEDRLRYSRVGRYFFNDLLKDKRRVIMSAAAYHPNTHILVTGFSNGDFFIHEMPLANMIHSLSISEQEITAAALNCTGDWIALGCSGSGQLLVWEWQSETYIMKQQGHFNNMSCLQYSPDGQYVVTGGDDGKVKIWNTSNGFCFVTFHEHTSSISAVQFAYNGKFVVSASVDGTVRAYDMTRYRNFRTFTSPQPAQFSCLAIDSSSEFIAAGCQDVFEIFLWSMKLGRLVEVLSGHEGPVMSLAFSPALVCTTLASVSWDRTLKVWDAIETGSSNESILLDADGLFVTFSPDGKEVAVATLDGQISLFDVRTASVTGFIEGRNDLGSGRSDTDLITAKKNLQGKAFHCLCYSADGQYILAGGQSKHVCIYNIRTKILVKKFVVTHNKSFDAIDDIIDRRKMTEFGNLALVEERERRDGGPVPIRLPGVRKGNMAARAFKPEVRVHHLQFSPTGQAWAAASTEGLLIYSLDYSVVFDPYKLEVEITPEAARACLYEGKSSEALMMALKLNESTLLQEIIEGTTVSDVELTVQSLPLEYMLRVLKFLAGGLEGTQHIEFYLLWVQAILTLHGPSVRGLQQRAMPVLLALQKNLTRKYDDLSRICDYNKYTLRYLQTVAQLKQAKLEPKGEDGAAVRDSDSDDMLMEAPVSL